MKKVYLICLSLFPIGFAVLFLFYSQTGSDVKKVSSPSTRLPRVLKKKSIIKDIKVSSPITPFYSLGDLWFSTWADDDTLFVSWGDGRGPLKKCPKSVGGVIAPIPGAPVSHHGLAKLTGNLPDVKAEVVKRFMPLSDDFNNSKPSSLLFYNGRLYVAIHSPLGDSNVGFIAYSDDYGKSFKYDVKNSPWTKGSNFRSLLFINMGKNYELNKDGYVYAFGIGKEWEWFGPIYLARVPKDKIIDYSAWEYFTGVDNSNNPHWSKDQFEAKPVPGLPTTERQDQFSSIFHPGVKRYLILTATGFEGKFYEAPAPWGPWRFVKKWFEGKDSKWFGNYQPGIIAKDTDSNSFYFTASGQAKNKDLHPCGNYRFKIGKITMILGEETQSPRPLPAKKINPFGLYDIVCATPRGLPTETCNYQYLYPNLKAAGATWVDLEVSHFLLKDKDKYLNYINNQGFTILAAVPQGFNRKFKDPFLVDKIDLVKYSSQLKNYVLKYPFIKYWHVVEEEDVDQFWPDTAENYALFLRVVYKTIKEANPKAKVVLGKCINCKYSYSDMPIDPKDEPIRVSVRPQFGLKILKELAELEKTEKNPKAPNKYKNNPNITQEEYDLIFKPDSFKDYFDVIAVGRSVRDQKDLKIVKDAFQSFGYNSKPIWAIDVGRKFSFFDPHKGVAFCEIPLEYEGARQIIKTYCQLLSLGIEKIAYNGVFFDHYNGSKRLEWFTHKLMVEKLKGFISVEKMSEGQYKFNFKEKKPIWVLWSPAFLKTITLNVGDIKAVKITKAVSKYNSGKDVKDYNTAFETEIKAVNNGKATLTLDKTPIYVEPSK